MITRVFCGEGFEGMAGNQVTIGIFAVLRVLTIESRRRANKKTWRVEIFLTDLEPRLIVVETSDVRRVVIRG